MLGMVLLVEAFIVIGSISHRSADHLDLTRHLLGSGGGTPSLALHRNMSASGIVMQTLLRGSDILLGDPWTHMISYLAKGDT